jgi:ribosomal protein L14
VSKVAKQAPDEMKKRGATMNAVVVHIDHDASEKGGVRWLSR